MWFTADASSACCATLSAKRQPSINTIGWSFSSMSFSASRNNSPASTTTLRFKTRTKAHLVVPSPTSWSWMRAKSHMIFAAALFTFIDFNMVAPSFVMRSEPFVVVTYGDESIYSNTFWMILSIPLGPRVDLTRSATAVAPTKESMRAFDP